MGIEVPPVLLSREDYMRRILAGAKTLREIDPELAEWRDRVESRYDWLIWGGLALLGLVVMVSVFVVVLRLE